MLNSVIYKKIECQIIFNYQNGNYEILFFDEVILVNEKEIEGFRTIKENQKKRE